MNECTSIYLYFLFNAAFNVFVHTIQPFLVHCFPDLNQNFESFFFLICLFTEQFVVYVPSFFPVLQFLQPYVCRQTETSCDKHTSMVLVKKSLDRKCVSTLEIKKYCCCFTNEAMVFAYFLLL